MLEIFEHTADLGLRIWAGDRQALFAEAARALFSVLVVDLEAVGHVETRTYTIDGEVDDLLLFDWLNELLYTFETERLLFSRFDVRLINNGLQAACQGERMDRSRHEMDHEVKAITYHELKVEHVAESWMAEVIVDI
jgi:SHS2 domain-containing protein